MGKYDKLFEYVKERGEDILTLSFTEIENILSFRIDHSFLNEKKNLEKLGFKVDKISMKEKWVRFTKL